MKKALLFFFLSVILSCPCAFAKEKVITGSVSYTVETAKNAAFSGFDLKIDKKFLEPYLKDENNKENREALKTGEYFSDREVMSFEAQQGVLTVKGYAVVYYDKPEYVFYYSTSGYLVCFDIDKKIEDDNNNDEFPTKISKYNPVTGNLISVALYISQDEQYVYTKNGKLKAHWIGDIGYNAKGKPIAKRSY